MQSYNTKPTKKLSASKTQELIEEAKENVTRWYDWFGHNITQFRDDKRFANGNQWQDWEINNYQSRSIEPLTHNLLKPVIRQIIGEAKNMQPALDMVPIDIETDNPANSKLIQNLVRHIAYGSNSAQAWSTALLNMLAGGWGVAGVQMEYISPLKFDQQIKIRRFAEPQNVGFDPLAKETSKRDGEFCFCWEAMSKKNFEKKYPGKDATTGAGLLGSYRGYIDMVDEDSVIVFEYYRREYEEKTLVELNNGQDFKLDVLKEEVEQATEQYLQMMTQKGVPLLAIPMLTKSNERDTQITKIRCYKLTNAELLEEYDYPDDKYLPFAFIDCMSEYRDGKQYTESFIFSAKIPQQVYNYSMTEITAGVRRARKEGAYMTPKQMAGHEAVYDYPDRQKSALPYNPDPTPGAAPGPIQKNPETISAHWFTLAEQAREDIQRTLGIYAPNRGELPNETSGAAIGRTVMQANLALVQLWQNLYDGMRAIGEMGLRLIPKVYDNERVVSLLDESGQQQNAVLNQVKPGGQVNNDVTQAAYNLEVKPIACFAMQNQMEKDFLLGIAQLQPSPITNLLLDLIASRLESPITSQAVKRLQSLVPPAVLAEEKGEKPPPPPPNPQMQMMQLQMQEMAQKIKNMETDRQVKIAKMHQDETQHGSDIALEAGKQNIQSQKIMADALTTKIKANTELRKAALGAHVQLTGMAAVKQAQKREGDSLH